MSLISIPYSFKNNESVGDCGIEYLIVDNSNFSLCGEKYFTLNVVNLPVIDGVQGVAFTYNEDTYVTTSLTPTETIQLLATAFTCPNGYCNGQEASFGWELTPLEADKWTSTTILNNVSPASVTYSFSDITVNAVVYNPLPHVFWQDNIDGNASENAYDFMQAIIDYIVSLNIPEYVGAVNNASNGVSNNLQGVGLLDLYFETGISVSIDITAPAPVISGTFTGGTATVVMLSLETDDTSNMAVGDVLTQTNWQITDGNTMIGNTTTPTATTFPYNIFCGNCALSESDNWLITEVIITQNTCARNNVAYGYVSIAEIADALAGNIQIGTSIN
jgi:hypothetical protein